MRLRRRQRRRVPGINTASVADISFTLLILFLVVTSMDEDKGMSRMLPPLHDEMAEPTEMIERNVLQLEIAADNTLTINGETTRLDEVGKRVRTFVDNPQNLPSLPEKNPKYIDLLGECNVTDTHIITLAADRKSDYDTYFKVQNEIVTAYKMLRDSMAQVRFHRPYAKCGEAQRAALREYYPQRVAEIYSREGEER